MARFGRTRPRAVVPLADAGVPGRRDTQLGVLGRSLAHASRLGLVVPPTWVVLADVLRHVVQARLPPGHDPGSLLRTIRRSIGIERAARARETLLEVELDDDVERELDTAFAALSADAPWGIAVRPSAIVADAGVARAAGLSGAELAVFGREELGRAIRRAWARSTSESALRYLRARRAREVSLAVVLSPVIVARASAILITDARFVSGAGAQDPSVGTERVVVAVPGLGVDPNPSGAEVSAIDGADAFRLLRPLAVDHRKIVRNEELVREPYVLGRESIVEPRAAEFVEIARRLETLGPSEVWCVIPERGEISVTDVRPWQHLGYPGVGTAQTLWARASAAEAPAQALTFLSRALLTQPILAGAARAKGARKRRAGRARDALAVVGGRPYLDISSVVAGPAAQDFIDAGGRVEVSGAQLPSDLGRARAPRASLGRAALRVAQMAAEQRVLADDVGRFEKDAETERRWLAEMDLAILPDDALTTTLHEVSNFLTRAHELHARTTASAVAGHGLLAAALAVADPASASFLAHAVTAGADVITAKPAAAFCHVAAIARYDEPARAWLTHPHRSSSSVEMPQGPLSRAIRRFLEAFGDRGFSEAELSTPRWGEDAKPVFAVLAAALRGDPADPDVACARARAHADSRLTLLEAKLSFFERRLVRDIVIRARDLLRLRERCRARVAHGLSMMRVVALDVDRRIRRLDPSLAPNAVFHLTLDELAVAVTKYRADLAPIVRSRQVDLAADRRAAPPPSVFRGAPPSLYPIPRSGPLTGLSASAGIAEGRVARVGNELEGVEHFSPGDVLVLESLDLGFSPLIVQASAVVAELGTPFSSTSVVARDFGVPIVTGVEGAWSKLRSGEAVRVDGDAGTVENLRS